MGGGGLGYEVEVYDEGGLLAAVGAGDACVDEEDGVVAAGDEAVKVGSVTHYERRYVEMGGGEVGVGTGKRNGVGGETTVPERSMLGVQVSFF